MKGRPAPKAEGRHRLRIRHPSGAEFEAEGDVDFILSEKREFVSNICQQQARTGQAGPASEPAQKDRDAHEPGGKAAPAEGLQGPASQASQGQGLEIWHKIAVFKQNILVLTIKSPEIAKSQAPLLIIAAAQNLGSLREYPAIRLSKSMKASGYLPERLDRLLIQSIKEGRITASGMKRNRSYRLTPRGLAEAFSLASKVLEIQG